MDDSSLVEQFIKGDDRALKKLIRRWESPIFQFCYRFFSNKYDAREVTQKTFIKVYYNIHKLNDHSKFSSWIYRIAFNLCKDESRNKHRRMSKFFIDTDHVDRKDLVNHKNQNPEQVLQHKQIHELLDQALSELPEEQRVVVIMKEYQGLKFIEIAEILEQPLSTVKSRMYYGLKGLRNTLTDWNIDKEVFGHGM
jgi:RNA polymerase sigma-70 factor (ECF subfamily)